LLVRASIAGCSAPTTRATSPKWRLPLEATKLGVDVLKPLSEHGRYDLAFDIGGRVLRVQCKTARRRGEVLVINLISSYPHFSCA
jgi:hypothetical protein